MTDRNSGTAQWGDARLAMSPHDLQRLSMNTGFLEWRFRGRPG